MYLNSSLGIKHKRNLDMLQAIAGVLATFKAPWVLAADFQCTPEQLEATGWLKLVKGQGGGAESVHVHGQSH